MNLETEKTVRKYFLLPQTLFERADEIGEELGLNFSELLRKALESFVNKVEKEKIDKEIAEACKFYYDIDKEMAAEWRSVEGKIWLERIFRGELYFVDLEPTQGHEMKKTRRCVVVSNNAINFNSPVIIICPVTDSYGKSSPVHIQIPETEGGLTKKRIAHCGQIRAIDQSRLGRKSGELSDETMEAITKGVAYAMEIPQINILYK